jgi:uncharacterized membrane protein
VTPTFFGRIQTRLFLLATIGVLATLVITPFLPITLTNGAVPESGFGFQLLIDTYGVTFTALIIVAVAGVAIWEPIYHLLQQFRWEKDWPTLFGLLTGVNEGLLTWIILQQLSLPVNIEMGPLGFSIDFAFVWLCVFLFANGPMRVVFIRWRFRGGRIG